MSMRAGPGVVPPSTKSLPPASRRLTLDTASASVASRQDCGTTVMARRLLVVLALVTGPVVSGQMSDGEAPVSGDSVVEQQDTRLARQDQQLTTALPALRLQLAAQDQKMAQQDQKMAQQDQKMVQQEALIGQLKENLADHRALIGRLNHKQDSQKLNFSDQEALWAQLNHTLADHSHKAADPGATWRPHTDQSSVTHATDQSSVTHATDQSSVTHATDQSSPPLPSLGSEAHDVMARAGDTDRLEGVVAALSQQAREMSADLQAQEHGQQQQTRDISADSSSLFVRWGAAACDSSSRLVYSGVVGGSHYTDIGAASNYMCLTTAPVMSRNTVPPYLALLYGGEYQTHDFPHNHNVVCAVCRSSFPTTLMVPGTNVCSPGWRLLYSGYLMAAAYHVNTVGSQFACVDYSLQAEVGNNADENGKLFYYTASRCGSLPCPPYQNNKVVTCAVCAQ